MQDLGFAATFPGLGYSEAHAVSADGNVVVGRTAGEPGDWHAMRWTSAGMVDLGSPKGTDDSAATAINNAGQILGSAYFPDPFRAEPLLWERGVLHLINDLIDRTSGWTVVQANDIDERGRIAATARHGTGSYRPVLLVRSVTPATATTPATPGAWFAAGIIEAKHDDHRR